MSAVVRSFPERIIGFAHAAFAAVTLLLLVGLLAPPLRAQISPGPLAKAHQSLSGATNCTQCHDLGRGAAQFKCLACHTEIRDRVNSRRGLHASFVGAGATGKDCVRCHSEHNGANFSLVHWEPARESLDHTKTGFALDGKHAAVSCAGCHKAANIPAGSRAGIQVKDLNRTYLGLSRACASCHADEHRGQLGADCGRCHTSAAWQQASRFNHKDAKYPLTGAHLQVACAKCHSPVRDAKPYVKYTGLSFTTCAGCHSDPHKGSFTAGCQSCHVTTNWSRVAQLQGFDHSKTKFPLLGKHKTTACSDCHTRGDFKTPVAHALCADCHRDAHRGQFQTRADKGECAACHTEDGFKPSTFDAKLHASTQYPLEGRHTAVTCEKCHLPKGEDTIFKIASVQCNQCHQDIHQGQFAAAPASNRCQSCHNLQGFQPALFAIAQHKSTRFPLTGAHLAVICADCHKPQPAGSTVAVKFRFEDRSCVRCHQDPHRNQFQVRMEARRTDGSAAGCEACHNTTNWTQVAGFDHSSTTFSLTGAHRGVACIACHRPPAIETTLKNANFTAAPKLCTGCHEDPHAKQFAARSDAADCSSCHDTVRWKPAQFDHNKRTPYPLDGAHQNVPCLACHKVAREVAAKMVVFYKPTSNRCQDCHAAK